MGKKSAKYDELDEVIFMTFAHFGSKVKIDDLHCLNCQDAGKGYCQGEGRSGMEVIACMLGKVLGGEKVFHMQVAQN
jgi:hypothetical protein